jgi:hypothetical protein
VASLTGTPFQQAARRQRREHEEYQKQCHKRSRNLQPAKFTDPGPSSNQPSWCIVRLRCDSSDEEEEVQEQEEDSDSSYENIEPVRDRYKDQTVSVAKEDSTYEKARNSYKAPSKKEVAYHTMRESVEAAVEAGTNIKKYYDAGEYYDASMVAADAAKMGIVGIGGLLGQGAKLGLGFAKEKVLLGAARRAFVPSNQQSTFADGNDEKDSYDEEYGSDQDFHSALYSVPPPFTTGPDEFAEGTIEHISDDRNNILHREPLPSGSKYLRRRKSRKPSADIRTSGVVGERGFVKRELRAMKDDRRNTALRKEAKTKTTKMNCSRAVERAEQRPKLDKAMAQERERKFQPPKNEETQSLAEK